MLKQFAVGLLICDRWGLTEKTLSSLFYSTQSSSSYDLFIIDNGSTQDNFDQLKKWVKGSFLKIKNIFRLNGVTIPQAWNLFLIATKDYQFRTLLDNDIVLYNTPVMLEPPKQKPTSVPEGGVNPGAVPVASIRPGGSGFYYPRNRSPKTVKEDDIDSSFLDQMQTNAEEMNAGIVSLVPVVPRLPFINAIQFLANQTYRSRPYLIGGCTMISKYCFEHIGYFDERLSRCAMIQYSQRALVRKINISYHTSYWTFHLGHDQPTSSKEVWEKQIRESMCILDSEPITDVFIGSKWKSVFSKISVAAKKGQIIVCC